MTQQPQTPEPGGRTARRPGRRSAGILLLRRSTTGGEIELLLGHMGGPLWSRKHEHAWSIPKGEYDATEDALDAAYREFREELGFACPLPPAALVALGDVGASGGKVLTMWAAQVGPGTGRPEPDLGRFRPGTFEMVWPPRSDRRATFPELDRVEWVPDTAAPDLLVKGQLPYLDRLAGAVVA